MMNNYLKRIFIIFGFSFILTNCHTENYSLEKDKVEQSALKIPSIADSKFNFETNKNVFLKTNHKHTSNNFNLFIDWKSSKVKNFSKDVKILYTPIEMNTRQRMKTFLASVKKNSQIETYSFTLIYDENSMKKWFSGIIFKHNLEGEFIEAYKYDEGIRTIKFDAKALEKSKTSVYKLAECSCVLSYEDLIWLANTCGECVENTLDCVCITGSGGSSDTTNDSYDSWSNPDTTLNTSDSGTSGTTGDTYDSGDSSDILNGKELNLDGVDPWWTEEVIAEEKIDDSTLEGKSKCLNDFLTKEGDSYVQELFANFKGDSEFDIKIESVENITIDGNVKNGLTFPPQNGLINIQINQNSANSRPALAVVRTILHEYIHADMFRKLNTAYSTQEILDFRNTYNSFKEGNFNASPQHETMADLYINEMANALKNFHKNVLVGDYNYLSNNGNNPIPNNFYEALAWQGLTQEGKVVDAYNQLSENKKIDLQNALENYYHSTTKNCPEN